MRMLSGQKGVQGKKIFTNERLAKLKRNAKT